MAHRNSMENEDETEPKVRASEIRNTSDIVRSSCEGHQTGHKEAVFG